jgi:hypothetical protein
MLAFSITCEENLIATIRNITNDYVPYERLVQYLERALFSFPIKKYILM